MSNKDFTITETLPLIAKQTLTYPRTPAAQLVLIKGPAFLDTQKLYQFKKNAILGRKDSADISVRDPKLSRLHAQIYYDGRTYVIKDLNSSNGTRVNGKYITEKRIFPKDLIEIGDLGFEFNFPTMIEKEENSKPRLLTIFDILKIASMAALFISSLILIYFSATYSPSKKRTPQSFKKPEVESPSAKLDLIDRAGIYFEMANQAYQQGDYHKAKSYLIEAKQIEPQERFSRLEQATEEALVLKNIYHEKGAVEKREKKTRETIDAYLKAAEKHIEKREWDLAIITYQETLLLDSDNEVAKRGIFNIGQMRHERPTLSFPRKRESYSQKKIEKMENLEEEEDDLAELKQEIETLWQEAEGLAGTQDYVEAKKKLEEILTLEPRYAPVLEKLATLDSLLGKKAQMIYSQAVIFESIPDIEAAKTQWKKITSMLSPEHPYHKKATQKLSKYATY